MSAERKSQTTLVEDFRWRGMVFHASEGLEELAAREKLTAYIGFDPSAASLHVGSLLPVMALARFQKLGHSPIAIVGGGTGMVGDPSGKSVERPLLTVAQIEENLQGLRRQLEPFLDFHAKENPARIVNNADWLTTISLMDFLRDYGKFFTVNYMLNKESVSRRLETEEGISFTEFSYMLLQAYDFLTCFDRYKCVLQMGGSDQWGNITAGMDLIKRLRRAQAHGLVFPLVTTATGSKFGKTEAGTVWLDPQLTSPYRFYQFWINTDDRDAATYLKFFTWLSREEIEELEKSLETAPQERAAQIRLAREVTRQVHGETALARAEKASKALFGEEISTLTPEELLDVLQEAPCTRVEKAKLHGAGMSIVDFAVLAGLAASKGEARRLLDGGGVYLNNRRITDAKKSVSLADALHGRFVVLRRGQKEFRLIFVEH
ncbi:MAG: tyrosine--tRNA ligase [Acidobacteria bacterium]|nr:tyrosine--tRNA ligase [Acidobacteriota bacterium]MCL5287521.1 tyrosine--tRNA ligase [Acidobacteriota bacterium]